MICIYPHIYLGYGDKEIYWIAATIAQENFSFEPHLAGSYGDCGEILHFDPFSTLPKSVPYFINCQYLAEGLDFVGKNIQNEISKPVRTTIDTKMFNMGEKDKKSAGRCGACKAMGCIPIPFEINDEIIKFQKFQLAHTDKSFLTVIIRKTCIFLNKLLYT